MMYKITQTSCTAMNFTFKNLEVGFRDHHSEFVNVLNYLSGKSTTYYYSANELS